jgi:sigma-B regulation protein RsbU (phosphoserine phosphatase)
VSLGRSTTLGLLTDWLTPEYQLQVLDGVLEAARERDVSVACFTEGLPGGAANDARATARLLGRENVDGVIILATGIEAQSETERERFLHSLRHLPLCSVAVELPGASGVLADNQSGLTEAIRHLVDTHGYRRLGFLGGPKNNPEAQQRHSAFLTALEEHGLNADERLMLPGNFTIDSGEEAARILLDERHVSIDEVDALVTANDGMALGVMSALAARGLRVPSDLAIVGFDDMPGARQAPVPLTTVRQPLREQGRSAVHLLLARVGVGPAERRVLRTELVIRRSCGCLGGIGRLPLSGADLRRRGGRTFEVALHERRDALLGEMSQAGRGQLGGLHPGWEGKLVSALLDELKGRSPDAFRLSLDDALHRVTADRTDLTVFDDVVSALWRHFIPCLLGDVALRTTLEGVLDGARLAVAAAAERQRHLDQEEHERLVHALLETTVELGAASTLEDVAAVIERRFARLGVLRLAVALFRDVANDDSVVRVLSFGGGRTRLERTRLAAREVPAAMLTAADRSELIVSPLDAEAVVYGIVCMELAHPTELVHSAVRTALSATLQRLPL